MVWLFPFLLISFGVWRFYVLSRVGVFEAWLGLALLITCLTLAGVYLMGALSCAAFC